MTAAPRPNGLRAGPLAELLNRLRARLRSNVLLHGVGTLAAALCLWIAFSFVADYFLNVPRWVRFVHLGVFSGLGVFVARRELLKKFAAVPGPSGLALLAERARPELDSLLVSAVEFQQRETPEESAERVGAVVAAAERVAPELDLALVVQRKPAAQRFALGAGLFGALALGLGVDAERGSIFLQRFLGSNTPWPKRTDLDLQIRLAEGQARIERDGEVLRVAVPRGIDVPISVVATGDQPSGVRLRFASGQDLMLSPTAGGGFGTVLRSVGEPLEFWATGGDDRDRIPRVELEVLDPPDLSALTLTITPPAYTGLQPVTVYDADARALVGSTIRVGAKVQPLGARGIVRLLPSDQVLKLEPAQFTDADGAIGAGLGLSFVLERDVRLRFELRDESGLENPDPGLIAIDAIEDRRPELEVQSPGRSDVETVVGGALALRVLASDDFGLGPVRWQARESRDESWTIEQELPRVGVPPDRGKTGGARAIHFRRIDVNELSAASAPAGSDSGTEPWDPVGLQFVIQATAEDTSEPPRSGTSVPVRLRVLSSDEFLRRLQDRLATARVDTAELSTAQRAARARAQELLLSMTEEGGAGELDVRALQKTLNSQRRVGSDAEALLRELTSVAELVLYARLDDSADALLDLYEQASAERYEQRFDAAPWRALTASPEASAGDAIGLTTHLLEIVSIALTLAEDRAVAANVALDDALSRGGGGSTREALVASIEAQGQVLTECENLLDRLAEWDNLQSIIGLTRDLLRRSEALQERTVRYAK